MHVDVSLLWLFCWNLQKYVTQIVRLVAIMYVLSYKVIDKKSLYAKQKHLGCKKERGQEEPATKSSDIK